MSIEDSIVGVFIAKSDETNVSYYNVTGSVPSVDVVLETILSHTGIYSLTPPGKVTIRKYGESFPTALSKSEWR